MNFSERSVVETQNQPWQAASASTAQYRWIERETGEARTTFIVEYAPGTQLDAQLIEYGEEILVLNGSLSDANADYGPGTFIKTPPGSTPDRMTRSGCTLFVKQHHLDVLDQAASVVDTVNAIWRPGLVKGLKVLPLSEFGGQHTAMVHWAPETYFSPHRHYGGEEVYVVEGVFEDEHGRYPAGTWIRSPHLSQHTPFSREGCLILVKVGHLPESEH